MLSPSASTDNGRSFFNAEGHLAALADVLAGIEEAAAQAYDAALRDPVTVEASGAAFAAFASACKPLPEVRVTRPAPAVGAVVSGLGDDYPHALLAATRLGWSTAVGGLLPLAVARGANPAVLGPELGALQAALSTQRAPALAPCERTLEWSEGCARLWRVRGGEGTPTVVVASLINRYYLLDLLSGQSLLEALPGPLYLLDWGVDDSDLPGVRALLAEALERFSAVRLLGYSMGGTLATMHAADHPDRVAALAVFGAPIDCSEGGSFTRWAEHADLEAVSGAYSAVPAPWVHAPFWALRPTVNLMKLTQLVRRWRQPGYLERFLAVELWNNDNVDVAGPLYRTWGQRLYRDNALWTGALADLGAIRCPVLAVAARADGIVPTACTLALAERTGGEAVTIPSGHVGALSGRRGLEALKAALVPFLGGAA